MCLVILLFGCSNRDKSLDQAMELRNKLQSSNGCEFVASICADYGEEVYQFTMQCQVDKDGILQFCVKAPSSISGITGTIQNEQGAITFDDRVLAFQTIADDQLTPVTAPFVFIKALQSGYLRGCTETGNGYQIMVDDSYAEDALCLNIWIDKNNTPISSEIFWQGRRVLTLSVEKFVFM